MKAKENKISPFPILFSSNHTSGYKDATFEAKVSTVNSFEKKCLEITILCELKNDYLKELILRKAASFYVNVECSKTYFRISKKFNTFAPERIEVSLADVSGSIEVFVGIVAEKRIPVFSSDSFANFYENEIFDVEKGSLLGADFEWNIPLDGICDFSIPISIKKSDSTNDDFREEYGGDVLTILLNDKSYELYKSLSATFRYTTAFSIIVPAISAALRKLIMDARGGHDSEQTDSPEEYFDASLRKWTLFIDKVIRKKYPDWSFENCELFDTSSDYFLDSVLRIAFGGIAMHLEKELSRSGEEGRE